MTKPQTPMQAVQAIGKRITGEDIPDALAEWVLWEQTGWPAFWDDEPMKCNRRDAKAFFEYGKGCARCGHRPTEDWVCESCEEILMNDDPADAPAPLPRVRQRARAVVNTQTI